MRGNGMFLHYIPTAMITPTLLALRDFSRIREIMTILAKYGLGEFVQRIKLSHKGLSVEEVTYKFPGEKKWSSIQSQKSVKNTYIKVN